MTIIWESAIQLNFNSLNVFFGPWKCVLAIGSLSHWGLTITPRQEANENKWGISFCSIIQWNLDNSKSKGPDSFVWIIETLNNWGLKCIHILKLGLHNDFELLRILNYWNLNYRGSTVNGMLSNLLESPQWAIQISTYNISFHDKIRKYS